MATAEGKICLDLLQVSPKGDLVLCKVGEAEEQTTGGLLLPSSAQSKPTSGSYSCWPVGNSFTFKPYAKLQVHFRRHCGAW